MARLPETEAEIAAVNRFHAEVCDNSADVDPKQEWEWHDLSFGFFLACGLSPQAAEEMATYVRYEEHYFQ